MKIVIDMNLSPKWCQVLEDAGHEATHWSQIGATDASDDATRALSPSVVQVRSDDIDPKFSRPPFWQHFSKLKARLKVAP